MRSPGRDVLSTLACLRALGVSIEETDGRYVITGRPSRDASLDCGNSGTTMRLLAGVVAGLPLRATLDGDDVAARSADGARRRPCFARPVRRSTTTDGHAPLTVVGASVAHARPPITFRSQARSCLEPLPWPG